VREDVLDQRSVSVAAARAIYGCHRPDHLDPVATKKLRAERRAANRKEGTAKSRQGRRRITDNIEVRREAGPACACASAPPTWDRCATTTRTTACAASPTSAPPTPTSRLQALHRRPAVFRQFFCPGCGALVENEIARSEDEVLPT